MTDATEQLDELHRRATSLHGHSLEVNSDVTLQLVAVYRAALAFRDRLESQGFVSRLSDAADPLYAALRGTP